MCGGLNLTQSLKNSSGKTLRPNILYNLGRLSSYTVIGGMLGGLGSVLSISVEIRAVIGIIAGFFMLLMALNILNLVPFLRKIRISAPLKAFGRLLSKWEKQRKKRSACELQNDGNGKISDKGNRSFFYIGLLNGFMPCGPLQSMQLLAVA